MCPRNRSLFSCVVVSILFHSSALSAQNPSQREMRLTPETTQPKEIDFFTHEGTAMSVDISPSNNWIVFDLLGNIYKVPVGGGDAELLTSDNNTAVNFHPRYSPNGKLIAFVSDRQGQNNLWLMDADGANPRPLVIDRESRFAHPTWTRDGRYIVVTRIFGVPRIGMEKRDLRLWIYSLEDGTGRELAGDPVTQTAWPTVSPDGKFVYFDSSTFSTSPIAGSPHTQYHIERIALQGGEIEHITRSQGLFRPPSLSKYRVPEFAPPDSFAPELSPNGRFLAFARRIPSGSTEVSGHKFDTRTALWVRDLHTGKERVLVDPIDPDRTETYARAVLRVVNGYSWFKDGGALLVPINGKLRKVSFPSGTVQTIPFKARVKRRLQPMATASLDIAEDRYRAKFLQWLSLSPDGSSNVFYAGGQLWTMSAATETPKPLTQMQNRIQLMPAWSPDGKWIAFVTWEDGDRGHVWKISADGGKPIRLTKEGGEYFHPAWSPDGKTLVVTVGSGETTRGNIITANLYWHLATLPAAGGQVEPIRSISGLSPFSGLTPASWNQDGRIYFLQYSRTVDHLQSRIRNSEISANAKVLTSIDQDGNDIRIHAILPTEIDTVALSPNHLRLAVRAGYEIYIAELSVGNDLIRVDFAETNHSSTLTRLSNGGGWFPVWRNNEILEYLNGNTLYVHNLSNNSVHKQAIDVFLKRNFAQGDLALIGGTVITGRLNDPPREGAIIIRNGRIQCLYECDIASVHKTIDVTGKFIMPGIIDVHDHNHAFSMGIASRHHSHSALQLAYGVTTAVNPFGLPIVDPSLSDLTEIGRVIGPRYLYTGFGIRGLSSSEKIGSEDDANRIVASHAASGAIGIKQFHVTTRRESQLLAQATRNHGGLYLTAEQGDLPYVLGLVLDGYTGWEHMLSYDTLHKDAVEFFGQAEITYSPTLIVGGLYHWAAPYFVSRYKPWLDRKFTNFMPWQRLSLYKRLGQRSRSEFSFPFIAEGVADVVRAGGNAAIGAHGEVPGLGAHFEMQIYASAMSPQEVIHMATMGGAKFIGASKSIGSIEVGKIADLIVLNSNPLDDISNSLDIEFVMSKGNLYQGDSLDQIWPFVNKYGPVPWTRAFELGPQFRSLEHWDR